MELEIYPQAADKSAIRFLESVILKMEVQDDNEAAKIIEWLIREINSAWENRDNIEPLYEAAPQPKVIEILKLLPKTNCKECGLPTCMFLPPRWPKA